jgi:hypothetical protein
MKQGNYFLLQKGVTNFKVTPGVKTSSSAGQTLSILAHVSYEQAWINGSGIYYAPNIKCCPSATRGII